MSFALAAALTAALLIQRDRGSAPDPGSPHSGSVVDSTQDADPPRRVIPPGPAALPAADRSDLPGADFPAASASGFQPMTKADRIDWIVGGTIGLRSLGVGALGAALQTGFDTPREWHRSWEGFGRRYAEREADVAISNSIEAGLGAIWGEQASYVRSSRRGVRPRLGHALQTVFLAERRDGRLAPAWGRYAGNVFNNVIENAWLPSSVTTWQATVVRSVSGFGSRAIGNVWEEFGPDVLHRVLRRRR